MKTLKTWGARFSAWLKRLLGNFGHPRATDQSNLPPFSRKTWGLYADIILQSLKTVFYYALGVAGVLFCLGLGIMGGYFAAIVDQAPIPTEAALSKTLNNVNQSASLYFADNVKLSNVQSDLVRDGVKINAMSPWVTKAIVATEDEEFYQHHGVVPKAVVRAVFSDLTGLGGQTGGSTLTQQVVKMQFLSSETTFKRKATEMMLAMRIEHFFSKADILQAYLNTAPFGRNNKGQNIAGVETAAQGLFGVSAAKLTLPQAAFIAGLPQSPSVYTPFTQTGKLKKNLSAGLDRQQTVLFRMYRANQITKAQYTAAKNYDLKKDFLPQQATPNDASQPYQYVYNMVTSEAKVILAQQLAKEAGYSAARLAKDSGLNTQFMDQATELMQTRGYQIHSTINKQVYNAMQTVVKSQASTFGPTQYTQEINPETGEMQTNAAPVQNGSVLLDNDTGAIVGFVGGVSGVLNHIYTLRSPGSTIKPMLVYAPAVENQLIGTKTMLADFKTHFPNNYSVTDFGGEIQNRFMPVSEALSQSYNIPTVNLYNELQKKVNVKSYMDKMGITTLTANDYSQLGLALGGTDYGVSVQEQASAFSTFARGGTHTDAFVIDQIVDPAGTVIYQHKTKSTRVFSKSTSYIMHNLLRDVIKTGTASQLGYQLNFDSDNLIGKTGTTNDFRDIWFIGSTPGLTLASWMGYDNSDGHSYQLPENASDLNEAYWAKLANGIYDEIPQQFKLKQTMARPDDVKSVTVNADTGMKNSTVNIDGQPYTVNGTTTTSLYNNWEPSGTVEDFGIGGTKANYKLFWDHFAGEANNYGLPTFNNADAITNTTTGQ